MKITRSPSSPTSKNVIFPLLQLHPSNCCVITANGLSPNHSHIIIPHFQSSKPLSAPSFQIDLLPFTFGGQIHCYNCFSLSPFCYSLVLIFNMIITFLTNPWKLGSHICTLHLLLIRWGTFHWGHMWKRSVVFCSPLSCFLNFIFHFLHTRCPYFETTEKWPSSVCLLPVSLSLFAFLLLNLMAASTFIIWITSGLRVPSTGHGWSISGQRML